MLHHSPALPLLNCLLLPVFLLLLLYHCPQDAEPVQVLLLLLVLYLLLLLLLLLLCQSPHNAQHVHVLHAMHAQRQLQAVSPPFAVQGPPASAVNAAYVHLLVCSGQGLPCLAQQDTL
jgi:hypothetical protein